MRLFVLLLIVVGFQGNAKPVTLLNKIQQLPESSLLEQNDFRNMRVASDPFNNDTKLVNKIFYLHYANVIAVNKEIDSHKSKFLSTNSTLLADKRTNSLWVRDSVVKIKKLADFIRAIDIPEPEVLIAAKIVNVNKNFVSQLGFKYGTGGEKRGGSTNLLMDLPSAAMVPGEFGFRVARLGGGALLDMELTALQNEGHGKIISEPKLLTLNRLPALIATGAEIPYQEKTGQGNTSTAFKKAVLGLKVTPEIISRKKILLKIAVNQDKVSDINVNGVPAIDTREIKTDVIVNNCETIVLGGIYETTRNKKIMQVPFLSSIPIIGAVFRHQETATEQRELLIFITPKIIA